MASNYDLKEIERMRALYIPQFSEPELWEKIGEYYGVKGPTVRRWYYRNRKPINPMDSTSDMIALRKTSDYWRFLWFYMTGEVSRDKISTIKQKIKAWAKEL